MKNLTRIILGIAATISIIFFTAGCEDNRYDDFAPTPPRNVTTITGDSRVDIMWDYNPEDDVAGYNVYYNYTYDGRYTLLGSTSQNYFIDYGAVNGTTYYYAVAAYDYNGNESELSYEEVFDTPRPEGFNIAVYDYLRFPNNAGYDFSEYTVVPFDGDGTDFFFENYSGAFYLNVWDDTDILDMGVTSDIYDISYAPTSGWVPLVQGENVKYTEAIPGHTYVIWTWDNRYAKIRIANITNERMTFHWAYQLVEGNRELKRSVVPDTRNKLPGKVLKNHQK